MDRFATPEQIPVSMKKIRPMIFYDLWKKLYQGRKKHPLSGSYTSTLFAKGINAIAQKVGEEAVELVIESKDNNKKLFLNEAADLLFHYMVLLRQKNIEFDEVLDILKERHKK